MENKHYYISIVNGDKRFHYGTHVSVNNNGILIMDNGDFIAHLPLTAIVYTDGNKPVEKASDDVWTSAPLIINRSTVSRCGAIWNKLRPW